MIDKMLLDFESVGRLAYKHDNVAIAMRTLDAGSSIRYADAILQLDYTVPVGHRFAIRTIHAGEPLLSWGQPFGTAIAEISPGNYICNETVLHELRQRSLSIMLPVSANFVDEVAPFTFDHVKVELEPALFLVSDSDISFMGYRRSSARGVGTRNTVVLLSASSLTAGFARELESMLKPLISDYPNIDGIVAVTHTEGEHADANNRDLVLRTLAGFMVHPNVGAVLVVDHGDEGVTNASLREFMLRNGYPLEDVLHRFISLKGGFEDYLTQGAEIVTGSLDVVNRMERAAAPLRDLRIALQCGGSDAFSGISGNPLAAWIAKEVIRRGGSANMAETDELIGAERHMLQRVKDQETAYRFLAMIERFQERVSRHGRSARANPSGGNVYRGLYNIYLKSLGAASKRHPDVRLDYVIDYAARMKETGFYFMDSPGNDLESVAGQVAAGCNLIFFVTGNGSITNFPFVPTIKIVTTSERFGLLANEMDINAGEYLEGALLTELGKRVLDFSIQVASGRRAAGERAGHSQVQIWRNWRQSESLNVGVSQAARQPDGRPLAVQGDVVIPDMRFPVWRTGNGWASDQVGLIMPTSLCSGQIARMCAHHLNDMGLGREQGLSRFVALAHTEGCGASSEIEYDATLLGYLRHPFVKHGLLLEHGCEKTHNAYMRHLMIQSGFDPEQFGWASVQLNGGLKAVIRKITDWFAEQIAGSEALKPVEVGLEAARIGLVTRGAISEMLARQLALLTRIIVAGGGLVIVPENDHLLDIPAYFQNVLAQESMSPTLRYAQYPEVAGFHIMQMVSDSWVERLTGLGAAGLEMMLALTNTRSMPGHPLIPVLQIGSDVTAVEEYLKDLDGVLKPGSDWSIDLLERIVAVLSRRYAPKSSTQGNVDFQITRGLLGVSL